jgi:hypothetical protein
LDGGFLNNDTFGAANTKDAFTNIVVCQQIYYLIFHLSWIPRPGHWIKGNESQGTNKLDLFESIKELHAHRWGRRRQRGQP